MRKLELSLDALQVESFATESTPADARGTVRANGDTSLRIACICDTNVYVCGGETLDVSCAGTCVATCANTCAATCGSTCDATCGDTCGSTCGCLNTFDATCLGTCGQTDGLHACIEPY